MLTDNLQLQNLDPTNPVELGEEITNALQTPEFLDSVNEFEDRQRDVVVGAAVEYLALDLPADQLSEYVRGLHTISQGNDLSGKSNGVIHALQLDFIKRKLTDETGDDTPITEEVIFNYINLHMAEQGYVYHGFNGTFRESIAEQGLSPDQRAWDIKDAEAVHNILKDAGHGNALGWLFVNSTERFFATENVRPLYRYASGSPEWFNHFSSEGMPNRPPYDKHAYVNRDYEAAKLNIDTFCSDLMDRDEQKIAEGKSYPNITQENAEVVRRFLDSCWDQFAGDTSQPMVALIPRSAIGKNHPLCENYEQYKEEGVDLVQYMDALAYDVDLRIRKTIDSADITIAELPTYTSVHSA